MLEFLPDPQALLAEAHRVLRPGGRLVLSQSDFDTLVLASEGVALARRLVQATATPSRTGWSGAFLFSLNDYAVVCARPAGGRA